jgi:hypothetical protein
MQLLYIFIVAVGDALHVLGVFAHHQERQKTKPVAEVFCAVCCGRCAGGGGDAKRVEAAGVTPAASTRFAPQPTALRPQHTAQYTYATGLVF